MNYLRRLANTNLGQAFLKSALVMSTFWVIMFGIHAFVSVLFWNLEVFIVLLLASIAWGTHINYAYEWGVDEDDATFTVVRKPESKGKGEE